jgi:hypothetical protein
LLSKDELKEKEEVVGSLKGNGMLPAMNLKAAFYFSYHDCPSYLNCMKEL